MTVKRRLALHGCIVFGGIALLGAAAIVGVRGLHQDFGIALHANEQQRHLYTVGAHVLTAREKLVDGHSDRRAAIDAYQRAVLLFSTYDDASAATGWMPDTRPRALELKATMDATGARLLRVDSKTAIDPAELASTLSGLADLSNQTQRIVRDRQVQTDRVHRWTLFTIVAIAAVVIVIGAGIALRQYRAVITPLHRLRDASRRIARGEWSARVPDGGDEEFAQVGGDFNRMVGDLEALYNDLEHRIDIKSRELVRSERLASVGYLAAGVAHEINNPLSIIAGYGERSLMRLEKRVDENSLKQVQQSLQIMCDEAFRCKRITEHLLTLSKGGGERAAVDLYALLGSVVNALSELGRFGERRVMMHAPFGAALSVHANDGELRQVMLNLLVNAIDATDAARGEIRITLARAGSDASVVVNDNGRGMSRDTLARAFEPFFTEKRGERGGAGLGLSIVHSIIRDHAGTISAHSDGPGTGSTFTIALPIRSRAFDESPEVRDARHG